MFKTLKMDHILVFFSECKLFRWIPASLDIKFMIQLRVSTLSNLKSIKRHIRDAVVMYKCPRDDKTMENLMTVEDNVHFSREKSLRDSKRVHQGARDVQGAHEKQPAQISLVYGFLPAVSHGIVGGGSDPGQPEEDEHSGAQEPEARLSELVPQAHYHRRDTEENYNSEVDHLRSELAVETVVQPRYERTHGQKSNPAVVKLCKEATNPLVLVAAHCVEREGEPHADDSASKEARKHQLFLDVDLLGGHGQEV